MALDGALGQNVPNREIGWRRTTAINKAWINKIWINRA
jgi:hypothetical protein